MTFTIYGFCKKLTKCIIGIERGIGYGSFIDGVGLNNGGNTLLGIIAVREGGAV